MIIGVTGPIASGKNELVGKLIEKGFVNLRVSDSLKEEARKRGVALEREPLQNLGNELRKNFGAGFLAEKLIEKIETKKNYVIDSIRNPKEIEVLKRNKDFLLVGFDAPLEKRIVFLLNRKKKGDPTSPQEIRAMEERDRGKGENENGQRVEDCLKMADKMIINDGTLDELNKKIIALFEEINI